MPQIVTATAFTTDDTQKVASIDAVWEGAEAYFTFANSPAAISLILGIAVAVTVIVVIASIIHENKTYIDYK